MCGFVIARGNPGYMRLIVYELMNEFVNFLIGKIRSACTQPCVYLPRIYSSNSMEIDCLITIEHMSYHISIFVDSQSVRFLSFGVQVVVDFDLF